MRGWSSRMRSGRLAGMARALGTAGVIGAVAVTGAMSAACSQPAPKPAPPPLVLSAEGPPHLVGEYHATWIPAEGAVRVEGDFTRMAGGQLNLDRRLAKFVRGLEVSAVDAASGAVRWEPVSTSELPIVLPVCLQRCLVRYRFALRQAAYDFDDLDWAEVRGGIVEAPPSTWLIPPALPASGPPNRLRFRVTTPPGTAFVTGVWRAPRTAAPREPGDARETKEPGDSDETIAASATTRDHARVWEIDLRDLWTSPYSAFGEMDVYPIDVPGGSIELAIGPGDTALPREDIVRWVEDSARAVAGYWGRFPMPGALVLFTVGSGWRIGGGRTLSGGGGTIAMQLGARATLPRYQADWVLVHELAHLGFPSVPRRHLWAQEGIASYVEPFARVRAGLLSEEEAWRSLIEGLPSGLPGYGDRGLDHTPTWGRTYWGGALYWLLCDLEIRKKTNGERGLEHALRGILAAGGHNAARWPLRETLALGDQAVGVSVLVPRYEAMKDAPHPVDLEKLEAELGVTVRRDEVIFDDDAPLAAVRRAITHGTDPK